MISVASFLIDYILLSPINRAVRMDDQAKGAASSLNKSIGELNQFAGKFSSGCQASGSGLRERLNQLIWGIGRRGFEAGYREAHAQCAREVMKTGEFPVMITYSGRPTLSPSAMGVVAIRSSVQKFRVFKLPVFAREISIWDWFAKPKR
jgi:hypothetical protein